MTISYFIMLKITSELKKHDIDLVFLPPYLPDLNPHRKNQLRELIQKILYSMRRIIIICKKMDRKIPVKKYKKIN